MKAKGDAGAGTSALQALNVDLFERDEQIWVSLFFENEDGSLGGLTQTPGLEFRDVTNSGGQSESRPVIQTPVKLGTVYKMVELTLTQRDNMVYRMLLGRTTLSSDFIVAPSESFVLGGTDTEPGTPQ